MGALKKVPVYAAFMVIDVCEKCGGEFFHAGELAAKIKLIETGFRKRRKVMMALSALAGAGVGFGVGRLTGRNKRYEGDDSPERKAQRRSQEARQELPWILTHPHLPAPANPAGAQFILTTSGNIAIIRFSMLSLEACAPLVY